MRKFIVGVAQLLFVAVLLTFLGVSHASATETFESYRMKMFERILPSTFIVRVFVGIPIRSHSNLWRAKNVPILMKKM